MRSAHCHAWLRRLALPTLKWSLLLDTQADWANRDIPPRHSLGAGRRQRSPVLTDSDRLGAVVVGQLVSCKQFAIDVDALALGPIEGLRVVQLQLFDFSEVFVDAAPNRLALPDRAREACLPRMLGRLRGGRCDELERRGGVL